MNAYERLIEALTILNKYDSPDKSVYAEHDELFAGPVASMVTPEDVTRLEELGWYVNSEDEGFHSFT